MSESTRFVSASVCLKVKATGEVLIQGLPYAQVLFRDKHTGINYVKLHQCRTTFYGVYVYQEIDARYPVRSYQYDELVLLKEDETSGWRTYLEEELTNNSEIPSEPTMAYWSYRSASAIPIRK